MWFLGGLQTLLFGCCSTGYGILAVVPLEQLKQMPNMNPTTASQLDHIHPWAGAAALALFLLGFCPGVAYLILGFFVKKQRPGPLLASLILVFAQTLVLGVVGLLSILGAVMQGDPMALTICLIFFGTPLLLQGFTIYYLFAAKSGRPAAPHNPWQ